MTQVAKKEDLVAKVQELVVLDEGVKSTKKAATAYTTAVVDAIHALLEEGFNVNVQGHGNYEIRERAARKGRNPQSGEEIDIPAGKTVGFKPNGIKTTVK